jgi:hypothetical protein
VQWIDFDLSGKDGADYYPPNYSHEINDARRHINATPYSPLSKVHDWFSLASMMDKYKPEDVSTVTVWDALVKKVRNGEVDDALIVDLGKVSNLIPKVSRR